MTEEDARNWFDESSTWEISISSKRNNVDSRMPIEDLYQAFKSRLKAEAALNVWPEEK